MADNTVTHDNVGAANELFHNMSALFAPELHKVAELNSETKKAAAASTGAPKADKGTTKTASAQKPITTRAVPASLPFVGVLDQSVIEKLASADAPLPVLGHLGDGTPVTIMDVMRHPAFKAGWEKRAAADIGFWDRMQTITGAAPQV